MKSQVLLTVRCNISGGAGGEIWHWSLSGVKGLNYDQRPRFVHVLTACSSFALVLGRGSSTAHVMKHRLYILRGGGGGELRCDFGTRHFSHWIMGREDITGTPRKWDLYRGWWESSPCIGCRPTPIETWFPPESYSNIATIVLLVLSFRSPWSIWCKLRLKEDSDEKASQPDVCLRSTHEVEIEIPVKFK